MNVMNRFTLRSMKANRKWTVVTIIGIIISTAMISAVSTFCESFMELMRNETKASNGNWYAVVSGVPAEDIYAFENADFISELSVSRDLGYAQLEGSQNRDKPYLYVREFDENSYKNYPVRLVEGRMPQNSSELLISAHIKDNGGIEYKVGDTIELEIGQRTTQDGQPLGQNNSFQETQQDDGEKLTVEQSRTYTVVGIVDRPSFEPTWAPGYTVFTIIDKAGLGAGDKVTVSLLTKRLSRSIFDDVLKLTQGLGLDDDQVMFNTELLRYYGITGNDTLQNVIYGFAGVFLAIIMVASVSLIYNAFAISVSERVTQLGMLASVGATKHQKRRSVYFEGLLLGLIGIPLGIFFGIAGIGITLSAISPLLDTFSNFTYSGGLTLHISPLSVAAAAVLAAITIFISVWIPARRASRIMPIDAIRQSKEVKLTRRAVKTSRLTRVLFGFEGEIALKNLKRSRKKYRATVLSLIISLVLFLTVSYYTEELDRASSAVETGYNFDFAISYSGDEPSEIEEADKKIASLDGVGEITFIQTGSAIFIADESKLTDFAKHVFPHTGSAIYIEDEQIPTDTEGQKASGKRDGLTIGFAPVFYCLDDASFDRYAQSLGINADEYRDTQNPRVVLINFTQGYLDGKKTVGKMFDIKQGDILNFKSKSKNVSLVDIEQPEISFSLELGFMTEERPMGVFYPPLNGMYVIVSRQVYEALPEDVKGVDMYGNPADIQTFLTANSPDKVNTLETQIQQLTKNITGSTSVFNVAQMAQSEKNVMTVMGVFIYGFISLICLISIANIFNTITTNVSLRRREFAMLRSVGMTPSSFNKMLRFESVFYGLKAMLYGLPISMAITLFLHNLQSDVFNIGFSLPWKSYIVAVVLIFVIVGTTMLYSSAKVKKENIIDALKRD